MAFDRGGLVSVIIPCYVVDEELLELTKGCISSIAAHCDNFEIVVVDNGSHHDDGDYLVAVSNVYIRNRRNLGFAPAVNQGFKLANGEWLCQCNNDVRFLDDWLSSALGAWDETTGVVAAHRKEGRELRRDTPWQVMWGALWTTHRDVVGKVGYLDERFRLGMREDRDYWLRMEAEGLDLVSVGHAWHKGNATWAKLPRIERRLAHADNKAYFKEKWSQTS